MKERGRYEGQPDWMPDCEIWEDCIGNIVFMINIDKEHVCCIRGDGPVIVNNVNFNRMFTPIYAQESHKPDDICVCWRNDRHYVITCWYKDIELDMWDHVIIMPEEYVGTRHSFLKCFWEKIDAEVVK